MRQRLSRQRCPVCDEWASDAIWKELSCQHCGSVHEWRSDRWVYVGSMYPWRSQLLLT